MENNIIFPPQGAGYYSVKYTPLNYVYCLVLPFILEKYKSVIGNDLYHEMIEGGVISLKDKTSKVALVYGQMNEPPGARARVALTGLTVAEYFRDQEGQDVLLFIDNIFRFTQV